VDQIECCKWARLVGAHSRIYTLKYITSFSTKR
jgi:hypothetical protein